MPQVFNDLGNSSAEPCGFTVGDLCGSGDYASWFRTMQIIDGQLAVIASPTSDADVADKLRAGVFRAQFATAMPPDSIKVQFLPSDRTHALAALAQQSADLVTSVAEEGETLPPDIFTPPADPGPGFGAGLFAGSATTVVLTVAAVGAGLWFANKKGWLG